ncbi:membrane dipeptidase [Pseudonocardia sp.]|jgi:membrane dipeptidase|uniref:dipeptidase n=1 Tax=Pseudonocardia sp. TaxID=60912 RepID=UPI0031FCE2F2
MTTTYPYLSGLSAPAPQVPVVPLAADVDRLPGEESTLDEAQRRRVEALLSAGPVISLHDHPIRLPHPLTAESWSRHKAAARDHLGYAGLAGSGMTGVFASALSGLDLPVLLRWLALLGTDLAHTDQARLAQRVGDVAAAGDAEALTVVLALEDLSSVGEDLAGVEVLYGAGVRSAGLTYNAPNALGCGLAVANDTGLTATGRAAVELMNSLGMLVDLAHVGDRTSLDAAAHSSRPVVISHAGARTVWGSARMKPDDVLRSVAATGGVIGIEAAPNSTRVSGRVEHNLDAVMRHVEYCAELLGIDHVALGPDTFFGDHVGMYAATGASPMPPPTGEPPATSRYVAGMENPGEAHRNAAGWLVARGWSDQDISAVLGGNVARVVKEVA